MHLKLQFFLVGGSKFHEFDMIHQNIKCLSNKKVPWLFLGDCRKGTYGKNLQKATAA